jgi:signal transduction histidine kinase
MLDLLPRAEPEPSWLRAPMPDAALCLALPQRLARLGQHESVAVAPQLLLALNAAGAEHQTLLACDSSGASWRLRRAGAAGTAQLWRLQALHDSRARFQARLRGLLAAQLAGRVQHELRNPLNALTLHADLIARLLQKNHAPDPAARLLPSVEVIRQRLQELEQRQDAAVALWLAPAEAAETVSFGAVVGDSLRLLRGWLSLHEVRLFHEGLAPLDALPLRGAAAPAQLGLLALLLMAATGARQYPAADGSGRIDLLGGADGALEIDAPLDGQALGREVAETDTEGLLGGLVLLFEPAGLRLETDAQQGVTRLSPLP